MIGVRALLWLIGFMGTLWAVIGIFHHLPDVGLGMAVTAASVVAWGLMDWLEER
jgi:hypothetical protein